jgi:3-hydroxybutyryl-CoA dehydrogenase
MSLQFITPYSVRLGIAGAGTMGSGIALTALLAGLTVTLYDLAPPALEKARVYIEQNLERKGRAGEIHHNLELTANLEDLAGAGIVIEGAPEDLGLKKALFARLDELCPPPAILATNTSTLPVTAIAAGLADPSRAAGMHFFNPAPVLPLVEIIRGARTAESTVETLVRLAEKLGKTPVVANDTPGFIVNRVARPFYGEALRILGEGSAAHDQIDRIVRSAGFRMGPFQLMDLIGIDVNLAAMQSMYEQSFGEPRYRPHRIQVQMVQQNALGRKTGRGFYNYEGPPEPDPSRPAPSKSPGRIYLSTGSWSPGLETVLKQYGYALEAELPGDAAGLQLAILTAGRDEGLKDLLSSVEEKLSPQVPILCQCADITLAEAVAWARRPQRLAGFDGLFCAGGDVLTLVLTPGLDPRAKAGLEDFARSLDRQPAWIEDNPGLVLPRIVCMLANEAAFALLDGVASADTIDLAMRLGVSYPKGPLEWAQEIGWVKVVAVLDHLHAEFGEERYRVAPLLRRWARQSLIANRTT